jgi:glycosyltransferase involved in cell wall biosynthesis
MRVQTLEVAPIDGKLKAKAAPSLEVLFAQHEGKVADKWSTYLREYDRILQEYRDLPIRFLEIGVQNGGSLEIWAQFFAGAHAIIGCDIDPVCAKLRYDDPRVSVVAEDANSDEAQRQIAVLAAELDIIVDDGSHRSSDIVRSFARYFPLLTDGGLFIVEDLHCSYWQEFEGGLFHPHSTMTFLKRLADVINHEHWGVPRFRNELLRRMGEEYGVQFHDRDLGRIHSIEFCNSMCVIRKAPTDDNMLGTRIVVGTEEPVAEGKIGLRGQRGPDRLDQETNAWSTRAQPPEDDVLQQSSRLAELEQALAAKENERVSLEQQLATSTRELEEAERRRLEVEEQRGVESAHKASIHEELQGLHAKLADQAAEQAQARAAERRRWRAALAERERQLADAVEVATDQNTAVAKLEMEHRAANRAREAVKQKLGHAEGALKNAQGELKKMRSTLSWRATQPLRKAGSVANHLAPGGYSLATRRARKVLREQGFSGATKRMLEIVTGRSGQPSGVAKSAPATAPQSAHIAPAIRDNYAEWLRQFDTLRSEGRAALVARASAFRQQPTVSVILRTHEPNLRSLSAAIESVRAQIYPHWELCVIDGSSSNPVVRVFLERLAEDDPRIRVSFRDGAPLAAATNAVLESVRGDWVTFLEQHDVLREHALFWVVEAVNLKSDVRLIYSDEDKLNERGQRIDPNFKCDWNPDLFLSHDMLAHLSAFHVSLLRGTGGLRAGFEGAESYDLALRCVEQIEAAQIHHVPRVLYTARVEAGDNTSSLEVRIPKQLAGQRALNEHFQRTGTRAHSELVEGGTYRTRYHLPDQVPLVSLVIPTRNALKLVRQCIDSVFNRTTYASYEILLVDNGSDDAAALAYFAELAKRQSVRVLRDDRPFNYSALNNMAVELAKGEFVCLLNNDIEVISPYWLNELVSIGLQPQVGAVGARLWYPNDTLQHGGVITGVGGVAGHAHKNLPKGNRGYHGRGDMSQSLSAVTGACLLIKRSIYQQVGGLNEAELKVAFNDVDFCLRVREAGYRNVWTPYANLYHHESASRGVEDTPEKVARFGREICFMKLRWGQGLFNDPAYSPNLSFELEDFSLAWPPRL